MKKNNEYSCTCETPYLFMPNQKSSKLYCNNCSGRVDGEYKSVQIFEFAKKKECDHIVGAWQAGDPYEKVSFFHVSGKEDYIAGMDFNRCPECGEKLNLK